jgi:serine/threonine protein kinase
LWPGTVLKEQYVLGRVLGHGGFGITYLGWDLNLARKIAIKEYFPAGVAARMSGNPSVFPHSKKFENEFRWGLERYLEEARTVARFQNHPFIVWVQNFFALHGTAYLILEFLEGATLEECLKSWGNLDFATAFRVMRPVMDALREVHSIGLLHRDISPDNIFVLRNGQIKVIDFGAARYALGQQSQNLSVILKHGYAPPEQYESRGSQGAWTDVYAVAATMYRCLTGEVPPSSPDRQARDQMQAPSAKGARIAAPQEAALLRALSLRVEERYADMPAFLGALVAGETGEQAVPAPVPAPQPAPLPSPQPAPGPAPAPLPQPLPKPKVSGVLLAWGGLAVVLLSALLGGMWYRSAHPEVKIERFEASNNEIVAGDEVRLSWAATGVDSVQVEGLGSQPARGSATVRPNATTRYRLLAGKLDSSLEVRVKPKEVPPANAPDPGPDQTPRRNDSEPSAAVQVVRCEIQPATVRPGENARLIWETRGAQTVFLEPDHRKLELAGYIDFTPRQTTTVRIVAHAGKVTASSTATVVVQAGTAPPGPGPGPGPSSNTELRILSFTAAPTQIVGGQPVTLSWQITGSTSARVEPLVGALPRAAGSMQVRATQSTRYVLTAMNAQGQQVQSSVDVQVAPPGPPPMRGQSFAVLHHHSGLRIPFIDLRNFRWENQQANNAVCQGAIQINNGVIRFQGSNGDGFQVPVSEVVEVSINDKLTMAGNRTFLIRLASGKKYNFVSREPIEGVVAAIQRAVHPGQ